MIKRTIYNKDLRATFAISIENKSVSYVINLQKCHDTR